jgi:hypothetical protein
MKTPAFASDVRGFTGAERALLIAFGLAVVLLVAALARRGSETAGGDAKRTLEAGASALRAGAGMGGLPGAGGLPRAGAASEARAALPATRAPSGPVPMPEGLKDTAYDGAFIGADGKAYPRGTRPDQIPPVLPSNGSQPTETIYYVNGINNDKAAQHRGMQQIADAASAKVIGIHNSTEGWNLPGAGVSVKDLVQSLKDKADIGTNHAVDQVADTVYTSIKAGRPIHLAAHSQGGLILSRALTDVRNRLMIEDGYSREEAERMLGLVRVETFGGAASSYPDGPKYTHYVNRLDPVPSALGLGPTERTIDVPVLPGLPFGPKVEVPSWGIGEKNEGAGRGAEVIRFNDKSGVHDLDTYLDHRKK